ncbi:MAG TPA: amidohydrolase family protein [Phycisphaerae bacterium]|nr:amidohydrolase family protein [Phycisphaerae bacterium]
MIVDCHTHIWQSPEQLGDGALVELSRPTVVAGQKMRLLPQADTANHLLATEPADRTFVLGFRSQYLGAQIPNDYIADYCREHADKLIGFAGIDPTETDALDQVTHVSRDLQLKGLCICPAAQDFHPSDTRAMAVYERAAALHLPIIFYPGTHLSPKTKMEYARPHLLDEVARSFPNLKIVISHMGYPWVDEMLVLLGKHQNVYSDVAALLRRPWIAYDALVRAHQFQVIDKLLFGSDFPFTTAGECIEALYTINQTTMGTNLPTVPRESLRGIVERDTLSLLGIQVLSGRMLASIPKQRRVHKAG